MAAMAAPSTAFAMMPEVELRLGTSRKHRSYWRGEPAPGRSAKPPEGSPAAAAALAGAVVVAGSLSVVGRAPGQGNRGRRRGRVPRLRRLAEVSIREFLLEHENPRPDTTSLRRPVTLPREQHVEAQIQEDEPSPHEEDPEVSLEEMRVRSLRDRQEEVRMAMEARRARRQEEATIAAAKPEVPDPWQAAFHQESHRWFYYNAETGESSWEHPAEVPARPPRPPEPPEPWQLAFDGDSSEWYYYNEETGAASWDVEVVQQAIQAAAEQLIENGRAALQQSLLAQEEEQAVQEEAQETKEDDEVQTHEVSLRLPQQEDVEEATVEHELHTQEEDVEDAGEEHELQAREALLRLSKQELREASLRAGIEDVDGCLKRELVAKLLASRAPVVTTS